MNAVVQGKEQGIFKGVAVVIDDGIDTEEPIQEIIRSIHAGGGYAVALKELPDKNADLANFANAAFFIMDWNLTGVPAGVTIPEGLYEDQVARNIEFLKALSQFRHAPVFIFTNQDVPEVERTLAQHPGLFGGPDKSHILVKSKAEIGNRVYEVLNEWAKTVPSVIALKAWERSQNNAANALFMDFHDRNRYWPVIFWQAFKDDGVPPSEELGRLINRLVASRMKPLDIDLAEFEANVAHEHADNRARYEEALLKVLEGERFLLRDRLDEMSIAPGDVFEVPNGAGQGNPKYYLNIRPECDCVMREGNRNPTLYLLKGKVVNDATTQIDERLGHIMEKDKEAVVFAMYKGRTVSFDFKELKLGPWNEWKEKRVGRLLPPFITRVLQRYSAYSQRPGMPRIPKVFVPAQPVADAPEPAPPEAPDINQAVAAH